MKPKISTNICKLLENEYLSTLKGMSLSELSEAYQQPLNNLTDLLDLMYAIYDNGLEQLFQNEQFLNIPIMAHYADGANETFIIEACSQGDNIANLPYRAISIDTDRYQCHLSFHAETPEYEIEDSKYKTVRDLLPLIKDMIE